MGMLIDGIWCEEDGIIEKGNYRRPASTIRVQDRPCLARMIGDEPDRFWLIASKSCPWSHRTVLVRGLKGLSLSVHYAFGPRVQGYVLNGGKGWSIPGTKITARHLHAIYSFHDTEFTGRATVPLLWDSAAQQIVSNESADILAVLDQVVPSGSKRHKAPCPGSVLIASDPIHSLPKASHFPSLKRFPGRSASGVARILTAPSASSARMPVSDAQM